MSGPTGLTSARTRRDVQALVDGGSAANAVLDAYRRAIGIMRELDEANDVNGVPTKPLGWRYQASLHGIATADGTPLTHDLLWNTCRHNSWFFLAWHRVYLYRFERIVQHHLGDQTWSLPYWDYTKGDEDSRRIPAPFREAVPGNFLFTTERDDAINGGEPIPEGFWSAGSPLGLDDFALPRENARNSFGGGIVEDVTPVRARGSLENVPHGSVHGAIGGWMGAFASAGHDPIFWLHHANLDRLWEVWLQARPGRVNPSDETWLGTSFTFYDVDESKVSTPIRDILDTTNLGYIYESIKPPNDMPVRPEPIPSLEGGIPMRSPELVGAAEDVPFAGRNTVRIALEPPLLGAEAEPSAGNWYLRVEGIVGNRPDAAGFAVYLDADGSGAEPPIRVGTIAAFGIAEASRSDETHDGTGITDSFDITDAVQALEARGLWNAATVLVTVEPVAVGDRTAFGRDVRAARVSIYRS